MLSCTWHLVYCCEVVIESLMFDKALQSGSILSIFCCCINISLFSTLCKLRWCWGKGSKCLTKLDQACFTALLQLSPTRYRMILILTLTLPLYMIDQYQKNLSISMLANAAQDSTSKSLVVPASPSPNPSSTQVYHENKLLHLSSYKI